MFMIFLLLCGYDSLPPLPDLSASSLPEPELWIGQPPHGLRLNGYAGQFSGIDADINAGPFKLRGSFERKDEWLITDAGQAAISCALRGPRCWIEPRLGTRLLQRRARYLQVRPGFDLILFTPSIIATGSIDWDRWQIDGTIVHEARTELMLAFDQIDYIPQLTLSTAYVGQDIVPAASLQFNVGAFHLKVGSRARTGPFSPSLSIAYAEPQFDISTSIRTGIKHNMLDSYFRPELPVVYPTAVPAETLSMAADLTMNLDLAGQTVGFSGSYQEWIYRLDIDSSYLVAGVHAVHELNLALSARNRFVIAGCHFDNCLSLSYAASDSALAFVPGHSIADTMALRISILEMTGAVHYIPDRAGVVAQLPALCRVSATAGVRLFMLKFYAAVDNITDVRTELYDGFFLTGRQYAAGTELKIRF